MRSRRRGAFTLATLLCAAAGGCERPASPGVGGAGGGSPAAGLAGLVIDGYVDDDRCRDCHEEAWARFQESPMSRSFVPAVPANMFENFQEAHLYHERSDRHYVMSERDGRYFVTRYQLDADGARYNEIEEQIEFVIGSGTHSRTYLYGNEAGELYHMPVAWNADIAGWSIHGGFDGPRHEGFTRPITRDCFGCHNSYPALPRGADLVGFRHAYPDTITRGIGCQRCHGPGAEHVRRAEDPELALSEVLEAIVNPINLEPPLADDACLQCHLQPASRLSSRIPLFGQGDFAFHAGDSMGERMFHLDFGDEPRRAERFQANHHPVRLHRSRCFTESEGALSCLTCHNPHDRPAPGERRAYYLEKCLTCHEVDGCGLGRMTDFASRYPQVADVAADDCVTCHMPLRRAEDLVHEIVTDHLIAWRPPASDLLERPAESLPVGGRPIAYWPDRAPPAPLDEVYLAIADLHQGAPAAVERLERAIDAAELDAVEPIAHLGEAYLGTGRLTEAARCFEQVIARRPDLPLPHVALGRVAVEMGDLDRAAGSFYRALELDERLPDAHFGLAVVHARQGAFDASEARLEEALRLRPNYVDALANLAFLHQHRGQFKRASEVYARLIALDPGQTELYFPLGMAQLLAGWEKDAAATFMRGRRLRPGDPRLAEAAAMALANLGRYEEAMDVLREARDLPHADEPTFLIITALVQRQRGSLVEAEASLVEARMLAQKQPSGSVVRDMLFDVARSLFTSR